MDKKAAYFIESPTRGAYWGIDEAGNPQFSRRRQGSIFRERVNAEARLTKVRKIVRDAIIVERELAAQ